MQSTPSSSSKHKLGSIEMGLLRSEGPKTQDRLVWAARSTTGLPVLVNVAKALPKTDWSNARWTVVRKGDLPYGSSAWQPLDRRRLLMVSQHHAVYEIVLAEPTINRDTNAFFPIRLKCEVGGLELHSKPFFVLREDALANMTKFSLECLDSWFLNPDFGLISVIQISTMRKKSLAAVFLHKHSGEQNYQDLFSPSGKSGHQSSSSVAVSPEETESLKGVRVKFLGGGSAVLHLVEQMYPVPIPMDDVKLLVAVSQIFHFTHESVHWVGDEASTRLLVGNTFLFGAGAVGERQQDKLHVYGSVVPFKGMYQHSNPRLKKPFEDLCLALKIILACNGLPRSWLENDGKVLELTDAEVKNRKFMTYSEIFASKEPGAVFNVNKTLEALSKSIFINSNGALFVDYSIVIPVLVNNLTELHSFFSHLTNSKLGNLLGRVVDQLCSVQTIVLELGRELAAIKEERLEYESSNRSIDVASRAVAEALRQWYRQQPLHLTQDVDFDSFVPPMFDLFEALHQDEGNRGRVQVWPQDREHEKSDTVLTFTELLETDLPVFRFVIRGGSGSGKTTLTRQIARQWAANQDSVFCGKFDVLLVLSLDCATTSTYADLKQVSLTDLVEREIVRPNAELSTLLPTSADVENWLASNRNRILWILDGVDTLETFVRNPENGMKAEVHSEASQSSEQVSFNVSDLLHSLQVGGEEDVMQHRIITTRPGVGRSAIQGDLFLTLRLFSNSDIRGFITRFFPVSEEANAVGPVGMASSVSDSETDAEVLGYHSSNEARGEDLLNSSGALASAHDPNMSERARKIWLTIEKMRVLGRDLLHVPLCVELVCASYLADARYHFTAAETMSDLFGRLFEWLKNASEGVDEFEPHLFKVAFSLLFKSKFQAPTLTNKAWKVVPRDHRRLMQLSRFFEPSTVSGFGFRFIHPMVAEYLAARHIAYIAFSEAEQFGNEMMARLRAKIINSDFHNVFLFLVGILRDDATRLGQLFDVILMDVKELGLLGPRGPSLVFKCWEESGQDRVVRSRVVDWFWKSFGQPRMQIWRSNFVINLLELMVFRLSRKGLDLADAFAYKQQAIRALGRLGVESNRVVLMLVKAARTYPDAVMDVVRAFQELGTSKVAIVPVLLDALRLTDPADLRVVLSEVRRMIRPPAVDLEAGSNVSTTPNRGGKTVISAAATKLIKIGMHCIENREHFDLLADVLRTLASWNYGGDAVLPLVVKSLENSNTEVRHWAISVVQYINLLGPNAYYNEKVIRLLESIGKKEPELRGDVIACFCAMGMDTEFSRGLMIGSILDESNPKLQARVIVMCAKYSVRTASVIDALAKMGLGGVDQQTRRLAIDVLAYIFLPKEPEQADVSGTLDAFKALQLSGAFVIQRVARMSEKKSKAHHLTFELFSDRYIM